VARKEKGGGDWAQNVANVARATVRERKFQARSGVGGADEFPLRLWAAPETQIVGVTSGLSIVLAQAKASVSTVGCVAWLAEVHGIREEVRQRSIIRVIALVTPSRCNEQIVRVPLVVP